MPGNDNQNIVPRASFIYLTDNRVQGINRENQTSHISMLKKVLSLIIMVFVLSGVACHAWGAKKITIKTIPENATISVDGQPVGEGSYKLKFEGGNDFYIISVKAPGYIERRYRLLKSNPNNSVVYRLEEDEALKASMGNEDGEELGNDWMDITCRRGMSEDVIWKRLMNIATTYFNNIDVRDKAAGWIKTRWKVTSFKNQKVRTRLEIRMSFTDEDQISYRARIISEINDDLDCKGQDCYKPYPRVLKKYQPMIEELQTSVGGGE